MAEIGFGDVAAGMLMSEKKKRDAAVNPMGAPAAPAKGTRNLERQPRPASRASQQIRIEFC